MTKLKKSAIFFVFALLIFPNDIFSLTSDVATVGYFNRSSFDIDIRKIDSYEAVFLVKQIAQSLIDEDKFGQLVPSVAKYWTVSPDMKKYTFFLYDNIYFHNGEKLAAVDVANSIAIVRDSTTNPLNYYLRNIETINIAGSYQIEIELKKPWAGFLHSLSSGLAPIFSKSAIEKQNKFVPSGSYRLVEEANRWFLKKHSLYRGNYPPSDLAFELLTLEQSSVVADIVASGQSKVSKSNLYTGTPIDSFTTFQFMVAPSRVKWQGRPQRLALIKLMMEAKATLTHPLINDLQDIVPRGMMGHDITNQAYRRLREELKSIDISVLSGKTVIIGSLGPIPRFDKFAKIAAQHFNVQVRNEVVVGENYLSKLRENSSVDVYSIGWASIFSHPDATFIPFYILGLEKFDSVVFEIKKAIANESEITKQYVLYRKLSEHLISEGYMLPQSQVNTVLLIRDGFKAGKSQYRYTIQLSEITRFK